MDNKWWNKDKPKGIFEPTESTFGGAPVLSLPVGPDGNPFSFGLKKAKATLMFLSVLAWASPVDCGLSYYSDEMYRVAYPHCIMSGPVGDFYLTEPGGRIELWKIQVTI